MFKRLQELVDDLNETNSTIDKKEKLKKIDTEIKEILFMIYNPFLQYNITSKNIIKNNEIIKENNLNILELLKMLNLRQVTGHEAIGLVNGFINNNIEYKELILNIIDKDLKCRIGASIINDVFPDFIPTFDVALANSYNSVSHRINIFDGNWFASSKIDGCRGITIIDNFGNVNCYSREGKEFFTLDVLKEEVKKLNLTSVVLDGEICIVDDNGKEDFQSIMKVIRKKDYTIPNPKYKLFDMIPLNDFFRKESRILLDERLYNLYGALQNYKGDKLEILNQKKITCEADLDMLLEKARENKWEGLIVRKNTFYKGKRSNDLLKIKDFHDAEYVVENTVNGKIRIINDDNKEETIEGLSSVVITHKGFKVNVGSGFSIDQRKLYKEHPEMIIGKTITVKYFEETQNKDGGISLRFPTIKHIYEDGRDV